MPICRRIDLMHPKAISSFSQLSNVMTKLWETKETKHWFRIFETVRDPVRQALCVENGTSTSPPWFSAHQYGLAADFAIWGETDLKYMWPDGAEWDRLKIEAEKLGLAVPITWDKGHVVHPLWKKYEKLV